MDHKELIEEITKQVLEKLGSGKSAISKEKDSADKCSSCGDFANSAILFTGGDEDLEMLEKITNGLELSRNKLMLIIAGDKRLWPSSVLKEKFNNVEFWDTSQKENYKLFLPEFDTLIVPIFNLTLMTKLAALLDENPEVKFIIEALNLKKNIFIIPDNLFKYSNLLDKIKDSISTINSYGIKCLNVVKTCSKDSKWESKCAAVMGECSSCGHCVELLKDKVKDVISSGADRISSTAGVGIDKELAAMIDHTLLKPDATKEQVVKLCEEARKYIFASVCINPSFVKTAHEILKGTPVKVCTVIGFPLGATTSMTKINETRDAVANGATEIDMVINVGALKARQYDIVREDISGVVGAAGGNIVKVILETALLTDEEKVKACELAKEAGADFVKTSTGFGPGGATAEDIALMRKTVGKYMGVKASGGIRDFETAQKMIKAGATRIGASASVSIVKGENAGEGKY